MTMHKHLVVRTIMGFLAFIFIFVLAADLDSAESANIDKALIKASLIGDMEEVQRLLTQGADINAVIGDVLHILT